MRRSSRSLYEYVHEPSLSLRHTIDNYYLRSEPISVPSSTKFFSNLIYLVQSKTVTKILPRKPTEVSSPLNGRHNTRYMRMRVHERYIGTLFTRLSNSVVLLFICLHLFHTPEAGTPTTHSPKKTSLPALVLFFISISGRRERSSKPEISCILQYVYILYIHIIYANFLYVGARETV